jgi:cytochrome c biogenesis protein CcmG/thiol:disulfide interchange protein DsbE
VRRTSPFRLIVLASIIAVTVAACTGRGPDGAKPAPRVSLPSSPTALPTFTSQQFQVLLKQLRGKPVVVNIWASWCGPCRSEAPQLAIVSKQYAGKVQFLGVDIQDQTVPARAFIEKYGWIYPSVADPTGAIRNGLGLIGVPVTLVFDRNGSVAFTWSGAVTTEILRAELAKLV